MCWPEMMGAMKRERAMGASSSFLSPQSRFEEAPFDEGLQLDSSSASMPMPMRAAPACRCEPAGHVAAMRSQEPRGHEFDSRREHCFFYTTESSAG